MDTVDNQATTDNRVKKGAAWLDSNAKPGWRSAINLNDLHLGSPFRCVLGQLANKGFIPGADQYGSAVGRLVGHGGHDEIDYGFCPGNGTPTTYASNEALVAAWTRYLTAPEQSEPSASELDDDQKELVRFALKRIVDELVSDKTLVSSPQAKTVIDAEILRVQDVLSVFA